VTLDENVRCRLLIEAPHCLCPREAFSAGTAGCTCPVKVAFGGNLARLVVSLLQYQIKHTSPRYDWEPSATPHPRRNPFPLFRNIVGRYAARVHAVFAASPWPDRGRNRRYHCLSGACAAVMPFLKRRALRRRVQHSCNGHSPWRCLKTRLHVTSDPPPHPRQGFTHLRCTIQATWFAAQSCAFPYGVLINTCVHSLRPEFCD